MTARAFAAGVLTAGLVAVGCSGGSDEKAEFCERKFDLPTTEATHNALNGRDVEAARRQLPKDIDGFGEIEEIAPAPVRDQVAVLRKSAEVTLEAIGGRAGGPQVPAEELESLRRRVIRDTSVAATGYVSYVVKECDVDASDIPVRSTSTAAPSTTTATSGSGASGGSGSSPPTTARSGG